MSIAISIVARVVSLYCFWFVNVRIGSIQFQRPSLKSLLENRKVDGPKIVIRTTIFCNSSIGQRIEYLFAELLFPDDKEKVFTIRAIKDNTLNLAPSLYVSREGITYDHHFLLNRAPDQSSDTFFVSGKYTLKILGRDNRSKKIQVFLTSHFSVEKPQVAEIFDDDIIYTYILDPLSNRCTQNLLSGTSNFKYNI